MWELEGGGGFESYKIGRAIASTAPIISASGLWYVLECEKTQRNERRMMKRALFSLRVLGNGGNSALNSEGLNPSNFKQD